MPAALIDGLANPVSAQETVRASTTVLIGKIAGIILDNLGNMDALKRFAEDLLANQASLATAMVTSTSIEEDEPEPVEED